MKRQDTINDLLKMIEKKQNRGEDGNIRIEFKKGKIISVSGFLTEKLRIKADKED